jgi:hypothetical protein
MQKLIVLAVVTLLIGCGGSGTSATPVSPDGPGICRNYASSVTKTTTTTYTGMNPAGTVSTQDVTASYNTGSNQLSETGTGMSGMCRSSVVWLTSYSSVADFVDEVSVIPPKTRWASQSGTGMYSGPSGPCRNDTLSGTTTNSYDSQGRLATSVSTGPIGGSLVATSLGNNNIYTAWDVFGRQAAYAHPGLGALNYVSYDDSARTRTTRYFAAPTTTADTFDSNGNLVRSLTVTRVPPPPHTGGREFVTTTDTIFVTHATRRVCR